MGYIEVAKGVSIYVEDINPGGGMPVLFIHGWPVNQKMYEYQFNLLPNYGFRCIGMDLRGFGNSSRPWNGFSYNQLADDLRAVVDTLGLKSFILVGFSIGGAIAIRYLARHEGFGVTKLALISAAAPVFTKRTDYPFGFSKEEVNMLLYKTYTDRPKMLSEFGSMFFASPITSEFAGWFQDLGLEASGHGTAMGLVALRDEDLRNDLPGVQVPTGIFHGILDRIVPFQSALQLHKGITQSELFPFEHSGHGVFYDELDRFNHTFLQFLLENKVTVR